ncbi:TetR/AcrR family transcriptional regulator [Gallaecimonas mangrovi]|uniref:TetR/AcrR family transcriptional regulator n=1 Tax=Gallaecimonas mangrovi TaxID=2291597 RepID=UPI000E203735|nr:TetR/AcrR family transcriptional regulator [Gallaecimonas mangrovi]
MPNIGDAAQLPVAEGNTRRIAIMHAALATFARFGYRKTSMEEIARTARISRPGLYFLFSSKEQLFREVVSHVLSEDLAEVERQLSTPGLPLAGRIVSAFDQWAGRYVGPLARDLAALIETNPEILGDIVTQAPERFSALVIDAIASSEKPEHREKAAALTQTLISASIGIKYQADTRDEYTARFATAVDLLLR